MPYLHPPQIILHEKPNILTLFHNSLQTFGMSMEKATLLRMPFHAWMSMQSPFPHCQLIMHSLQRHNRMIQIFPTSPPHHCNSKLYPYRILQRPYYVICLLPHHTHTFLNAFTISFLSSFMAMLILESGPHSTYLLTDLFGLASTEIFVNGPNHAFPASKPKFTITLSLP